MRGSATWLELAYQARSSADLADDAASRCAMLEIVAIYERQAEAAEFLPNLAWNFGAFPMRAW
jgi:hypothetical protein